MNQSANEPCYGLTPYFATELYNLDDDIGETKNLAGQHPDKVKELAALLEQTRTADRSHP